MGGTHFTEHDGARIGYRDDGAGPALVLLHGTGGDGDANWSGVLAGLDGRRVIRPDYAGSGLTTDDTAPLSVDRLAAQVLAAVDHAGVDGFDLVGFSLGAALARRS